MENETFKVVNELIELNDSLSGINNRPIKETIETIEQRNPAYLEAVKSTGEMPEHPVDLMMDYGIWNLLKLYSEHQKNWVEIFKTYLEQDSQPGRPQMVKALWEHVEMVIKDTKG